MDFAKRFSLPSGWEIQVAGEKHEIILTAKKGEKEIALHAPDALTEAVFSLSPDEETPSGRYSIPGLRFSTEETADALLVHTCPTDEEGAPCSRLMAHYRFEKAGENAVRLSAWFGAREPVRAQRLSLFAFRTDKAPFDACVGFDPEYVWPFGSLGHTVRMGAAGLRGKDGYILLSGCGQVEYTPEAEGNGCVLAVCPGQAENVDLRQFDARHPVSCVFSVGEGEPALPTVSPLSLPSGKAAQGKKHLLRSGRLQMALWERPGGVSLGGISLKDFSPMEDLSSPLTLLRLYSLSDQKTLDVTSEQEWERVRVQSREGLMRVSLENPFGIPLTVTVEGRAAEGDTIEWRVKVLGRPADYTVVSASFPALAFGGGEGQVFFKPKNSGMLEENAFSREIGWSAPYPAGYRCSMPVMGVYDAGKKTGSGLYAAVHMSAAERVELGAAFFRCGEGRFTFDYPAQGLGLEGNSFELAGHLTVRVLDGDWYDMAKIYGAWVHGHADWCPPKGREDSPDWMRDTPLYVMDWMPNDNPDADPVPISIRPPVEPPRDNWIKKPIELADRLGMPIGYHLYNWHFNPFNNDFPYYFPVKEGLEEGVLRLNAHKVHVMPYINGRIVDTRDTRGDNIRFDRYLLSGVTKKPNGSFLIETYASHEPDGTLCRLAAMCPTTAYWRNILAETCRRLFREYHMSAVYIDQVGASESNLCCDRTHAHQPGNGEWWVRGYRLLMERLRAEMPEGCGFTTESGAECYADQFDGFLTWQWVEPNLVPFLPKIYAGRVAMLGRNTNGYKKKDGLYCRYHLGQALMFGQQMGWINPDVVDEEEKIDYLERLCHARWDAREFFTRGEMLRPPVVVSGGGRFLTDSNMRRPDFHYADTLLAAAWQCGGKVMLMITNCADEETEARVAFDEGECGTPRGAEEKAYGSCRLLSLEKNEARAKMSGRSCLVITWEQ